MQPALSLLPQLRGAERLPLFKAIPITERVRFRLNGDFFNVLNHPGNPNSVGSTGILSVRSSGTSPRQVQLTGRITW